MSIEYSWPIPALFFSALVVCYFLFRDVMEEEWNGRNPPRRVHWYQMPWDNRRKCPDCGKELEMAGTWRMEATHGVYTCSCGYHRTVML
jgi:hypothetical protein